MFITLKCGYCAGIVEFNQKLDLVAPDRGFAKVSCPHCGSRMVLDINVRKAGKSTKVKKAEAEKKQKAEKELEGRYGATADALVKPWSSLTVTERRNAAWKLGHRG